MLADRVIQCALKKLVDTNFSFGFKKFNDFLNDHLYFVENFKQEILATVNDLSKEKPSSSAVSYLYKQYSISKELTSGISGSYTEGRAIVVADLIIALNDIYRSMLSGLILRGLTKDLGFKETTKYTEFVIDKDSSLDEIARRTLGSERRLDEILIANPWVFSFTREELLGKVLLIPNEEAAQGAVSENIGETSWGLDLLDSLSVTVEGDLEVSDFETSLKQSVDHILRYPRFSVPEDSNIGNPLLDAIGSDRANLDETIKARNLKNVLEDDLLIDKAEVTNLQVKEDKITASVYIKPINSEDVKEYEV